MALTRTRRGGDLLRQAAHKHGRAALRSRVVDVSGPGGAVVDRAHQDQFARRRRDVAVALSGKLPEGGPGHQELPGQVRREDRVPLVERHVQRRVVPLHAGVGHHDVDPAEPRDGRPEHLADGGLLPGVGLRRQPLRPRPVQGATHLRNRVVVAAIVSTTEAPAAA